MLLEKQITRLTDDGGFEVDLRPQFDIYFRYTSWEKGLKIFRWDKDHWEAENLDPSFPLITGAHKTMQGMPVSLFINSIPQTVQHYAEMFFYNQTTLLQVSAQNAYAQDLLCNNPILLWLICETIQHKKCSHKELDNLIRLPQHQILKSLTRNGSKIAVRFLRKIQLQSGTKNDLRLIVWALKRNWLLERVRHLPVISIPLIAALFRFPELSISKILHSLPASLSENLPTAQATASRLRQIWQDTLELGNALDMENRRQVLKNCNSIEALERLHDRWVLRLNARKISETVETTFPAPPIPGEDWIQPICTPEDLRQEGRNMQHCVASYVDRVFRGHAYIYQVLHPQRATLEVKLHNGKMWLGQCSLQRNGKPSEETLSAINKWFERGMGIAGNQKNNNSDGG